MSGVARFHDKLHRANHHTLSSAGLLDSATDPIASPQYPFQGTFALNGQLSSSGNITGNDLFLNQGAIIEGSLILGDSAYPFTNGGLICDITGAYNTPNTNQFSLVIGYANGVYIRPWLSVPSVSASADVTAASGVFTRGNITDAFISTLSANNAYGNLVQGATVSGALVVAPSASITNGYISNRLGIGIQNPQYPLHVIGDAVFSGSITSTGSAFFVNTVFSTTSAVSVVNTGTGPAFVAVQTGEQPIAAFYDDSTIAMYIDGTSTRPGYVGIGTNTPNTKLTVSGDISASGIVYGTIPGFSLITTTSGQWNRAYTQLTSSSAFWQTNYTLTNGNSGFWATNYTLTNGNSGFWATNYTVTNANSGRWSQVYTQVNASSAFWQAAYSTVNGTSGFWQAGYSSTNGNSGFWSQVYTQVVASSAGWGTGGNSVPGQTAYSQLTASSGFWQAAYSTTNANSATWSAGGNPINGQTAYSQLTASSGFWQAVYSTTNANSGFWAQSYTLVNTTSGRWEGAFTFVTTNSATYTKYTNLSSSFAAFTNATITGGLSAATLTLTGANIQTITSEVSAGSDFLLIYLNGTTRKIRLWD